MQSHLRIPLAVEAVVEDDDPNVEVNDVAEVDDVTVAGVTAALIRFTSGSEMRLPKRTVRGNVAER